MQGQHQEVARIKKESANEKCQKIISNLFRISFFINLPEG